MVNVLFVAGFVFSVIFRS